MLSLDRHILSNVSRVAARDSGRTVATVQDLYVALCEDDSVYVMFKSMKGTSYNPTRFIHRVIGHNFLCSSLRADRYAVQDAASATEQITVQEQSERRQGVSIIAIIACCTRCVVSRVVAVAGLVRVLQTSGRHDAGATTG